MPALDEGYMGLDEREFREGLVAATQQKSAAGIPAATRSWCSVVGGCVRVTWVR